MCVDVASFVVQVEEREEAAAVRVCYASEARVYPAGRQVPGRQLGVADRVPREALVCVAVVVVKCGVCFGMNMCFR